MIINDKDLLKLAPIKDMLQTKVKGRASSHGLTEAGYDLRLKQNIRFTTHFNGTARERVVYVDDEMQQGHFVLASAIEEFQMPTNLVGRVHDKSTWARHGLSVFNTVVEPGWHGWLTLELVYHGNKDLILPAGCGIAQVLFDELSLEREYNGKYANQPDCPVGPR